MEGILGIFQGIASSDTENVDTYLKALNEHQSFRLEVFNGSDPVVQHITSVLSKPSTRYEGLVLLNSFLEQCSAEVLEQKGVLWMTLALKSCNSKEAENVGSLVYVVLKSLAIKCAEIPDVCKAFVSNILNKIYDSLSTAIPAAYHAALQCVETCLRLYPGPSGPSRGSIEKFVIRFTDAIDESLILWSGKCLHLLQQVRGGGVQGISHKIAWQNYQTKLLGSLHNVMDTAFTNCTEVYDDPVEKEQLNIAPLQLSDEPVKRAMQLYIRFRNLVNYLVTALRQPFPVPKTIQPKKILNLISRGLSVTCVMLQKNKIIDNLAIGALLPKMQVHLFKLLEAVILTLRNHLAMHHTSILGFVFDTLRWTSSKKSAGQQKPYTNLRSAAYKALALWCSTMNHGSRCEVIAEGIVEEIIFDITPFENAFTLKVLSGAKKHMSKKARRQLHKAQNEQSNLAQTHSNPSDSQGKKQLHTDKGNQDLCIAALQCLRIVFLSTGCFLKPTVVKSTHLKITGICLLLSNTVLKSDHLYSNYLCRLELYNVLQCFILAPHHLCPPPTQVTVKLLQIAQIGDTNSLVRDICSVFLSNLEKIIHPQKESLVFPPDIREIRNAFHKVGKEKLLRVGYDNSNDEESEDSDDNESSEDDENEKFNGYAEDKEDNKKEESTERQKSPETNDIEMESLEKQTPVNLTALDKIPNSIDLTSDDSHLKESIQLDSSNDSVQFIPEAALRMKDNLADRLAMEEEVELSKSPELTLRVEEEDEDEDELKEDTNAEKVNIQTENEVIKSNNLDKYDQSEDEASLPKRPRIEADDLEKEDKANEEIVPNENGTSFEEIAASFVDELN